MSKMSMVERDNYRSYSPSAKDRYKTCKTNAVMIHNSNTVKHELAKCVGAIMVRRWGDVKFDAQVIDMIDRFDKYIEKVLFKDWPKSPSAFLTEAWVNKDRRVDLVSLNLGVHYEFETNHKEDKKAEYPDEDIVNIFI